MRHFDTTAFTSHLAESAGDPARIRIAGYPNCGKTYLSTALQRKFQSAIHVQSESWIFPLHYRKERDLSGAHPESYDVVTCRRDLETLFSGQQVSLRNYSHRIGDYDGAVTVLAHRHEGIILDGTPFALPVFDCFASSCFWIVPADNEAWLESAIERDVTTRFFSKSEATRHNMRKVRDLETMRQSLRGVAIVKFDLRALTYEVCT